MNFFKSILSDDPEPENPDNKRNFNAKSPPNHQQTEKSESEYTDLNSASSGEVSGGSLWSFGDLVKTITTRSESVLETYRRDLKEFGSGLRKESDLFREVANRAVKDLPNSIEVGASAIDGVLKSTVEIISQGTDGVLEPSDADDSVNSVNSVNSESVRSSRVYNRFDSQLNAIQTDVRTYCDDPEDLDEYNKWKLGFVLSDMEGEIEKLIGGGGSVEEIYKKVVPNRVDAVSFWCRYFYRVYKLKQQEEMRVHFVRRALSVDDEEELSWDVDDDEEDETHLPETETKQNSYDKSETVTSNAVEDDHVNKNSDVAVANTNNVPKNYQNHEYSENGGEDRLDDKTGVEAVKLSGGGASDYQKAESMAKTDETLVCNDKYGKDLQADEDLEWDEIGDIGDDDEKHVVQGETVKKGEFLKRVNIAEDDEDLSWDIEDDDEPVKSTNARGQRNRKKTLDFFKIYNAVGALRGSGVSQALSAPSIKMVALYFNSECLAL